MQNKDDTRWIDILIYYSVFLNKRVIFLPIPIYSRGNYRCDLNLNWVFSLLAWRMYSSFIPSTVSCYLYWHFFTAYFISTFPIPVFFINEDSLSYKMHDNVNSIFYMFDFIQRCSAEQRKLSLNLYYIYERGSEHKWRKTPTKTVSR